MLPSILQWLQLAESAQLFALFGAAFIIGAAKSGLKGISMLAVPLLAINFGAKNSTGLLLPILLTGDVLAIIYYRRDCEWSYIWRLFPMAIAGVILAVFFGDWINEDSFRNAVAIVVLLSIVLVLYLEKYPLKPEQLKSKTPALLAGLAGGFTTMIGNVGGTVMNIFLLSMRLPKNAFIGTAAYFFLLINLVKLPFHVFVWQTISATSLVQNIAVAPLVILGFLLGLLVVRRIPEKGFRYLVIVVTVIAAIRMLVG